MVLFFEILLILFLVCFIIYLFGGDEIVAFILKIVFGLGVLFLIGYIMGLGMKMAIGV